MLSKDIKKLLLEHWVKLPHPWLTSQEYHIPDVSEIRSIIPLSGVRDIQFQKDKMECENYALFLHAFVKKYCVEKKDWKHQVAFGDVIGLRMQTVSYNKSHALNIAITKQGIFLIEPQTYQIFQPAKRIRARDRNYIYKVDM
jgi:hypothetical protein